MTKMVDLGTWTIDDVFLKLKATRRRFLRSMTAAVDSIDRANRAWSEMLLLLDELERRRLENNDRTE